MGKSSKMKLALCLVACVASTFSKNLGSINVKDYGEVYVVAPDWSAGNIQMHDNGFTMRGNSRLYFASRPEDGWTSDMYWQANLMDKHFAYTLVCATTVVISRTWLAPT